MSAIITEKFRLHNAKQFYESFNETGSDEGNSLNSFYYFFIGKTTSYIDGDNYGITNSVNDNLPPLAQDDVTSENYAWDSMIAAKRISSTDITHVVHRKNWTTGATYDMYRNDLRGPSSLDPTGNLSTNGYDNLWESDFYFMTSAYRVYKVLYNDNGNPHTETTEPSDEDVEPFFSGNYLIKYLYTMTASEIDKFLTTNFIPVPVDRNNPSDSGKINVIDVVNGGSGYTEGIYYTRIQGDGVGAVARIVVSANGVIQPFGPSSSLNSGVIDESITVINSGYTYGYINLNDVYDDTNLSNQVSISAGTPSLEAIVKPIISPNGGHGYDVVSELGAHYVLMNIKLNQFEGDDITVENDFRQLGIVVNPLNYNDSTISTESTRRQTYAIHFDAISTQDFAVDEKITQATTGAVGRVVEWDRTNKILYFVQERHYDYGITSNYNYVAFSGDNIVSGDSGATGTIDTTLEVSISLSGGNTIVFSNGYAYPELEPDSGDIIYLENRRPISRAADQSEDIKITIEF